MLKALVLVLLLVSCGGRPAANAVAVTGYDVAVQVYVWADAELDAEHRGAALLAIQAVKNAKLDILKECPETPEECAQGAYESIMVKWEAEHDWKGRLQRIEHAKALLDAWHDALVKETDPGKLSRDGIAAVLAAVDELGQLGVKAPPELLTALEALQTLAHMKGTK